MLVRLKSPKVKRIFTFVIFFQFIFGCSRSSNIAANNVVLPINNLLALEAELRQEKDENSEQARTIRFDLIVKAIEHSMVLRSQKQSYYPHHVGLCYNLADFDNWRCEGRSVLYADDAIHICENQRKPIQLVAGASSLDFIQSGNNKPSDLHLFKVGIGESLDMHINEFKNVVNLDLEENDAVVLNSTHLNNRCHAIMAIFQIPGGYIKYSWAIRNKA